MLYAVTLALLMTTGVASVAGAPIASAAIGSGIPVPPGSPDVLYPGQTLQPGQALYDGFDVLIMQGDGNLVSYIANDGYVVWNSGTSVPGSYVAMQTQGNLVIYAPGTGGAVWATNTVPGTGIKLVEQGGPVLYTPGNVAVWVSGSHTPDYEDTLFSGQDLYPNQGLVSYNGDYEAVLQTQGNFVLYNLVEGRALWSTPVDNAQSVLSMQTDGNLVLNSTYWIGATTPPVYWYTGTNSSSPVRLVMQNDGNLVLYSSTRAIWDYESGRI
jgi:hypothetical protein